MDFPPELIFVLVAGLIGGINWLVQRSRAFRKASLEQQQRREQEGTLADLERAEPPRRPRIELPAELALPRQPRRPPRLAVGEPPFTPVEPPPRRVQRVKRPAARAPTGSAAGLAERRRRQGPLAWREAVILLEILGPPKSKVRRRF